MSHTALALLLLSALGTAPVPPATNGRLLVPSLRTGRPDLVRVDPATGTTTNLTATPAADELFPAWSPDGKTVAFAVHTDKGESEIAVMRADGTGRRTLAAAREDGELCLFPAWSSDGKTVAYARTQPGVKAELRTVNADGTGDALLLDHAAAPTWSPDGKLLAANRWDADARRFRLVVLNADGTGVRVLVEDMGANDLCFPAWSPDGKWIAYPAQTKDAPAVEVHLVSPDGRRHRQITHVGGVSVHPVWLADDYLLCTHLQPHGGAAYLSVRADAARLAVHPLTRFETAHKLLRPAVYHAPRVTPAAPADGDVRPVAHAEVIPATGPRLTPVSWLRPADKVVVDVAWTPDGKGFACVATDGTLGMAAVTPDSLRVSGELKAHPGGTTAAAWAADGTRLYSAGRDKALRAWAPPADEPAATAADLTDWGTALAADPAGKWVASGGRDGVVTVRDPKTLDARKEIPFVPGRKAEVAAVAWAKDGGTLFAAGGSFSTAITGGAVAAFDPATGEDKWRAKGTFGGVLGVALSPDGGTLAGACADARVRLWDAATGKERAAWKGHLDQVTGVAWTPDGKAVVTGGFDHTVRVWDAATGTPTATLAAHLGPVTRVRLSPDGKTLASVGVDRILLWKLAAD